MSETEKRKKEVSFLHEKNFLDLEFKKLFPDNVWLSKGSMFFLLDKKRYSEKEMNFFKKLIQFKIEKTRKSIIPIEIKRGANIIDNASCYADNMFLKKSNKRLLKYISNLKRALERINSKDYGICQKTGELIHPKRLQIVPHTSTRVANKII